MLRKECPALRNAVKYLVQLAQVRAVSIGNASGLTDAPVNLTQFVPGTAYTREAAHFPVEIVSLILENTPSPPHEHDPSLWLGPRSPWMCHLRFLKSLALVCRAWWEPATRVLYQHITLRRMGQIPALAHTLSSATESGRYLSTFIKHITVRDCIVLPQCANAVRENLQIIFQRCTSLRSFTFQDHPHISLIRSGRTELFHNPPLDPTWVSLGIGKTVLETCLTSSLHELHIVMHFDQEDMVELHRSLTSMTRLQTLGLEREPFLSHNSSDRTSPNFRLPLPLCLEFLEDLTLDAAFVDASSWSLPRLRSLTVTHCSRMPVSLLKAHGKALAYLNVCPAWTVWRENRYTYARDDLEPVLEYCTVLEHLVVPAISTFELSSRHQKLNRGPLSRLRYIDSWVVDWTASYPAKNMGWVSQDWLLEDIDQTMFPVLGTRIRTLIGAPVHTDLPRICHPASLSSDGTGASLRFHTVCGYPVTQGRCCVYVHIPPPESESDSGSEVHEDGYNSDGSYAPGSDEEDRTSWISDDDTSDDGRDVDDDCVEGEGEADPGHRTVEDESSAEEPELSSEAVLAMFRRSQEGDYLLLDEES